MTHLPQDHLWDDDVAGRYDTPGTGMFADEVLGPTVDLLADAGRRRPRARAGHRHRPGRRTARRAAASHVTGIELSAPMVAKLREKSSTSPRSPW